MNKSYKVGEYELTVSFKSDTVMMINAEHVPTRQVFVNEGAELMRIKNDTVMATLEKKSQKNLRCECQQIIKQGNKFLSISFIVNFDYLPEFTEEVELQYVERKDREKTIQMGNCHTQIQEINQILDSFEKEGKITADVFATTQMLSVNFNWKKIVPKGKYILRTSGTIFSSSGINNGNDISFTIKVPKRDPQKVSCGVYFLSVYVYPFSFSELVDCEQEGQVQMKCITGGMRICLDRLNRSFGQKI